jgi:cold shock CspA family protein
MADGTVKWFNPSKGYGLIQPKAAARMCLCTSLLSSVLD